MPYYRSAGHMPPKRYTVHRDASGALLYEKLVGEEGFSSDSSLLYPGFRSGARRYTAKAFLDAVTSRRRRTPAA